MRTSWTDDLITHHLRSIGAELGRMPSANELRARGLASLAAVLCRRGGFAAWRARLGLAEKPSETATGVRVQVAAAHILRQRGYAVAEQTTKAPFDLLVGNVRVDVKAGRYHGACAGYVVALGKVPPTCDLYLIAPLDEIGEVLSWYCIPAAAAHVVTITITRQGKYDHYRDAFAELDRLIDLRSIG